MAGFGQKLRQEREGRNFTLAQVAEATRISRRYLEALESDNLSALPGSVFNKGYVRSFATFIGADPEPLIRAYLEEEAAQQEAGRIEPLDVMAGLAEAAERNSRRDPAGEPRRRLPVVAATIVVLAALGGWALFRLATSSSTPPTPAARPAQQPSQPVTTPDVDAATRPAAAADTEPAGETGTSATRETAGDEGSTAAGHNAAAPATPAPAAPPQPREPLAQEEPAARRLRSTRTAESAAAEPPTETRTVPPRPVAAEGQISISEFGVGTGVVNRQLVGRADRFAANTKVWFWTRVLGANKGDVIRHVWMHEGKTVSSIKLTLGGSHWRTQSRKTLRAPGRWSVEARDAQDRVLARTDFVCEEPS